MDTAPINASIRLFEATFERSEVEVLVLFGIDDVVLIMQILNFPFPLGVFAVVQLVLFAPELGLSFDVFLNAGVVGLH